MTVLPQSLCVALQLVLLLLAGLLAQIPLRAAAPGGAARVAHGRHDSLPDHGRIFRLSASSRDRFSHIGVVVALPAAPAPMIIESLDLGHHTSTDLWTGRVKEGCNCTRYTNACWSTAGGAAACRGAPPARRRRRAAAGPGRAGARAPVLPLRAALHPQSAVSVGRLAMLAEMYSRRSFPYRHRRPSRRTASAPPWRRCYLMWGIMRPR